MDNQNESQKKSIGEFCFNIFDVIGEGYSSKVYKGEHAQTRKIVAIKVISFESYSSPIQKTLLKNEIKILLQIDDPNLLKVYEISKSKNNTYIVSEYCESGNLEALIKKEPLSIDQALNILSQISKGIFSLHKAGIIHRDLKPANILIKDGVYKVADFGFALIEDQQESIIKKFSVGTPMYMAPEIILFNSYSEKSDIWALGMMFYEMIFHEQPNYKQTQKVILKTIQEKCETLEKNYQQIILQLFKGMLNLESDLRYSAKQILDIIKEVQINKTQLSPLVKLQQKSISSQFNSPLQHKKMVSSQDLRQKYQNSIRSIKPMSCDQNQIYNFVKQVNKTDVSQFTITSDEDRQSKQFSKTETKKQYSHFRQNSHQTIECNAQMSTDCSIQKSPKASDQNIVKLPAMIRPTFLFCQYLEIVIDQLENNQIKYKFLLQKLLAIKAKVFYSFAPIFIKTQLQKWIEQLKENYEKLESCIDLNLDTTFQLFFNDQLNDQGKLLSMYLVSLGNQILRQEKNIHIQTIVSVLQENLQHQNDPFLFARKWSQEK